MGIEVLAGNEALSKILKVLNDDETSRCVLAERTVSRTLAGSCSVPLGAYASISGNELVIKGFVATPDGSQIIHAEAKGEKSDFYKLGKSLSQLLIDKGAMDILSDP